MRKDKHIFTKEEAGNLVNFFATLQKIHNRLVKEGYKISDGKITPPEGKDIK